MRSAIVSTLLLVAATVSVECRQSPLQLKLHPLDANELASPAQWQFLASTLQDVDVVALPESIHMTHELPIVRLGIIKFLNEQMRFHVLAMEGSLVDAWATQDRFLASEKSEQDAADAQLSLFPLWNTPEIRQLFAYEAASWTTATPLYITSYDVQPGSGKGTYGIESLRLLADRLATYTPPPAGLTLEAWFSDLQPLIAACAQFTSAKSQAAVRAIEQLESWIVTAAPAVAARVPHVPAHAAALRLIPTNLRGSLALCRAMTAGASANYKVLRDREGAAFAEALRDKLTDRTLMLWAHWSHLAYHDASGGSSVGAELRQKLDRRIYTIMPVVERGRAIVIFPNRGSDDDIGFGWVRPGSDEFSRRMQEASPMPFFLDLRDPAVTNDNTFAGTQTVWVESRPIAVSLITNADAIVWLKHINPPELPLPVLLIMGGMHYRMTLAVSASFVAVLALSTFVWRWRKRK